ncbi:MAG: penicillin-binding transpeptidase domain-containing protein [bacterium]|nr:penicillin-binding transpeptidase domain-containing protein [bacterium]
MIFFRRKNKISGKTEIFPDEIFLDSSNIPKFDKHQFEGRIEKPISKKVIAISGVVFVAVAVIFLGKIWMLQVGQGRAYALRAEENRLRHTIVFSERGVIFDRKGTVVAYNEPPLPGNEFSYRKYTDLPGLAHVLGYVKYPSKDSAGFYYKEDFDGVAGVEKMFDDALSGTNGLRIIETNALGAVASESVISSAKDGENIHLSIDAGLQTALHSYMRDLTRDGGYAGGAAVVLNVKTGEILAMTNVPEFDSTVLADGKDAEKIKSFVEDPNMPFLNRVAQGLYTPGSIVKPFVALAALSEGVIDPRKNILSTGSISIANPYDKTQVSVFKDWKAHGYVDMREALAVSSNVYFYAISGGYEDQKGVGIDKISEYVRKFGFGEPVEKNHWLFGKEGVVPTPEWKKSVFGGDEWRLGDTYNTSIGQYGFQATPLQIARAIAAIANEGTLVYPTFTKNTYETQDAIGKKIEIKSDYFDIVKEGMRDAVVADYGTARSLNFPFVSVAAKTGTAEVGTTKKSVHSWVAGFFPYEEPQYSFVVVMERGPSENILPASRVMRGMFEWMGIYRQEYLK